jgi:hypothetical protein
MSKPKALANIDVDQKLDPVLMARLTKVLESLRDLED